jgi:hypothetical protein
MVIQNSRIISQLLEDMRSSNEKTARSAYKKVLKIPDLVTKVGLITFMARNCSFEKPAQKAFADLKKEMSASGEYTPEEQAGQLEEMVYYGCRVPKIRILAIEHILGLIEEGKIRTDADGAVRFLSFIVENAKDKESPTVLRARRIMKP